MKKFERLLAKQLKKEIPDFEKNFQSVIQTPSNEILRRRKGLFVKASAVFASFIFVVVVGIVFYMSIHTELPIMNSSTVPPSETTSFTSLVTTSGTSKTTDRTVAITDETVVTLEQGREQMKLNLKAAPQKDFMEYRIEYNTNMSVNAFIYQYRAGIIKVYRHSNDKPDLERYEKRLVLGKPCYVLKNGNYMNVWYEDGGICYYLSLADRNIADSLEFLKQFLIE